MREEGGLPLFFLLSVFEKKKKICGKQKMWVLMISLIQ